MAPLQLEGDTLGQKHQSYNNLLKDILQKNEPFQDAELSEDGDLYNLLKIDVASKNKNVDYLMKTLKSEDDLYVSKAIKRSKWLITDAQYADIINPEYLFMQLQPQLTTRAFNKLMLSVRLHLKDVTRVEEFYNFIKVHDNKSAFKWLQHCSIAFIEKEVEIYADKIPLHLLVRLFEKSFEAFKIYTKKSYWGKGYSIICEADFLIVQYPVQFLDFVESFEHRPNVRFSPKATKIIMAKCPERILNKFENYMRSVHLETFVDYLKKKHDIKQFLLKHVNNEKLSYLFEYENAKYYLKYIAKEDFEFIKKLFIDKEKEIVEKPNDFDEEECTEMEDCVMMCSPAVRTRSSNVYQWYKFAPFNIAFKELVKLIRTESNASNRITILLVLLSCAGKNTEHVHKVLQYFFERHINEPFMIKIQFVNKFIEHVYIHDIMMLEENTWEVLDQLFHSMEVYIESNNNVQQCIQLIIVRTIILKKDVPDIITQKMRFDTMKKAYDKLKNKDYKLAVFEYLLDHLTKKIEMLNLLDKTDFEQGIPLIRDYLNLIKDNKDLSKYPFVIEKVKELIRIKKDKNWDDSLSSLYEVKKSWKKFFFEESLVLSPTPHTLLNALKHDATLIARNKEEMTKIICDDDISITKALKKIRLYWDSTFSGAWVSSYMQHLDKPSSHKPLVIGLCTLLPPKQLNELLNKYAPTQSKTDWKSNTENHIEFSICKNLASAVHIARPLVSLESVLLFAKGDYLQYVVPSLNSILSQICGAKCRLYIPKLLDAPVSLQKFGLRCAFHKLETQELKPILSDIWKSTKNSSIRTVLFSYTYQFLCKEKNDANILHLWDLLSMFIDKLAPDENVLIYKKMGMGTSQVPMSVRAQYFMKSFSFLKSLPAKSNCEDFLRHLDYAVTDLVPYLDEGFVITEYLKDFNDTMGKEKEVYSKIQVLALFILSSKDEATEMRRYETILAPILHRYLPQYEKCIDKEYRIAQHINDILKYLFQLKPMIRSNIPIKSFTHIQSQLENILSPIKHYKLLTTWKLAVAFVKILKSNESIITKNTYDTTDDRFSDEEEKEVAKIHERVAPEFAKVCVQYLKEDLNKFGSTIYSLFSSAMNKMFEDYFTSSGCRVASRLEYIRCLISESGDNREIYLMIRGLLTFMNYIYGEEDLGKLEPIKTKLLSVASDEVKMHFYEIFEIYP